MGLAPRPCDMHTETMRNARFFTFLAVLAAGFGADSPVKFDTPRVRVLKVANAPGQKSAMHKHDVNRVMICLDDGHMTLTGPGGKVERVRRKSGDVRWSSGIRNLLSTARNEVTPGVVDGGWRLCQRHRPQWRSRDLAQEPGRRMGPAFCCAEGFQ